MAVNNVPTLYRNIMDGLPSDFARDVFLWAVERPSESAMCYCAEAFAREADEIAAKLVPMLDAGAKIHGMKRHDPAMLNFIMTRHANWRYGGNVKPSYAEVPA